jgi:hypothetical protein
VECFLVEEQAERVTNARSWHVLSAYNVLAHGGHARDGGAVT